MYVTVRVKLKSGEITTIRTELPKDIRNYKEDTISDFISDKLDDDGVEYKWYRVESKCK